jgi:hypothetical protein
VRPRRDHRGFDLISDALPFGRLWYGEPNAVAEDFKTINGKDYKNATVSRVEADGIVLKSKSGITKLYFTELPKDIQERFHYDSAQGAHFTADREATGAQQNVAFGEHRLGATADQFVAQYGAPQDSPSLDKNFPLLDGSDSSQLCV